MSNRRLSIRDIVVKYVNRCYGHISICWECSRCPLFVGCLLDSFDNRRKNVK